MSWTYKHIVKPVFFRFDPEAVHDFMTSSGEFLGSFSLGRTLVQGLYDYRGPDISKTVDGIRYRTPFLLSAGFDYNARLTQILPCIGFGGAEVGSVTARACSGNPKPRLTRLVQSQSIMVNKGLRNDGVAAIIARLKKRRRINGFVTGVSIARTNDAQAADVEAGLADYATSFKQLNAAGVGDYYTLNISCPNAFGGETFANADLLARLLVEIKKTVCSKPVYVKLPINLPWPEIEQLIAIVVNHGLQGVVIGNLNKNYDDLTVRAEAPANYRGGLSGRPCFDLSTGLITQARQRFGKDLTIIGVGGTLRPEDALAKFAAGADLVQLITGLIFNGPGFVRQLGNSYAAAGKSLASQAAI